MRWQRPARVRRTNPTMTPTKMAKKYQACWAKSDGAGSNARTNATATGTIAFHDQADAFALAGLAGPPGRGSEAGIGVVIPPTVFGACVHRYLSFAWRVCSFARPVPTSSSRRLSGQNARQARRFYSFKGARPRECEAMPASKKMSPVRHRDEGPSKRKQKGRRLRT